MYDPTTFAALPNATSSQESAFGATRFAVPAGQMIDLFGPVPARANLSARQAKALRLLTSGTFGRPSTTSSKSAALQSSLESKLRARLSMTGSTLYTLTWKPWVTPSGVSRSRLRASVRRTSATGTTGWPTPQTSDSTGGGQVKRAMGETRHGANLNDFALLATWPTPRAADGEKNMRTLEGALSEIERKGSPQDLCMAAVLSGWPTPLRQDSESSGGEGSLARGGARAHSDIDHKVHAAGPVNGFWRASDWLACRDAKWRPVEPGTQPLADGAPARVVRLRGYGNAVNAEAARAWIETVMECI